MAGISIQFDKLVVYPIYQRLSFTSICNQVLQPVKGYMLIHPTQYYKSGYNGYSANKCYRPFNIDKVSYDAC